MLSVNDFYSNTEMGISASWSRAYISSIYYQVGIGTPVESRFKDTPPWEIGRLRINLKEQSIVPTIRQLYNALKVVKEEDILIILKRYTKTNKVIDIIRELKFLDLRKLVAMVIWLTGILKLRVSSIGLVEDLETGQLQFIGIYIGDCDWDGWKIISRTVKKQLISEGFDDVAGRVALVCKQAFRTQRG